MDNQNNCENSQASNSNFTSIDDIISARLEKAILINRTSGPDRVLIPPNCDPKCAQPLMHRILKLFLEKNQDLSKNQLRFLFQIDEYIPSYSDEFTSFFIRGDETYFKVSFTSVIYSLHFNVRRDLVEIKIDESGVEIFQTFGYLTSYSQKDITGAVKLLASLSHKE